MLILGARTHEEIVIQPIDDLDPALTVAELFAHGPIVITPERTYGATQYDRLGIDAPPILSIKRQSRGRARLSKARP